jgi:hypothetical protein
MKPEVHPAGGMCVLCFPGCHLGASPLTSLAGSPTGTVSVDSLGSCGLQGTPVCMDLSMAA